MGNMVNGDVYKCEACNLEVAITEACDEEQCDLTCCGQQLKKKE